MAGTASSCGLAILESLEFLQYLRGQPAFSVKRDFFSEDPKFRWPALITETRDDEIVYLFLIQLPLYLSSSIDLKP